MCFEKILPFFKGGFTIYRKHFLEITYTFVERHGEAFILKNTYGHESLIFTFEIDDLLADDWVYIQE